VTPTTLFPTLQETLELHDQLILRFGGSKGVRDLGLLESALVRPQSGYYDTLSMQAAALLQSLCQNHCFVDGNKRVAFASTAIFLRMNGYRLSVKPDDGSIERNTWGCCAGYRASKSALNSINKTFAVDFGKQGATFVVMHPGYVKTDMNEGQGNITPNQSGAGLMNVITGLDASDNGKFYDWQGNELPW